MMADRLSNRETVCLLKGHRRFDFIIEVLV